MAVLIKICDLDIGIYRCVSSDIQTSEVIITEERIKHIQEDHPEDNERYCSNKPKIILEPDYIVEANKANTAVLLKEFTENGEKFKLILRLKTPDLPKGYKNSVISFWRIGQTTWEKTINNKKILYKKE